MRKLCIGRQLSIDTNDYFGSGRDGWGPSALPHHWRRSQSGQERTFKVEDRTSGTDWLQPLGSEWSNDGSRQNPTVAVTAA